MLEKAGCELVRVAVLGMDDVSYGKIKKLVFVSC